MLVKVGVFFVFFHFDLLQCWKKFEKDFTYLQLHNFFQTTNFILNRVNK